MKQIRTVASPLVAIPSNRTIVLKTPGQSAAKYQTSEKAATPARTFIIFDEILTLLRKL